MPRVYPSKLLLLGEYTIIQHSAALAIPYSKYSSFWSDEFPITFKTSLDEEVCKKGLLSIHQELQAKASSLINLEQLRRDLKNGLWLVSNTPIGYGLGSSGTVCAALYDRYGYNLTDKVALQKLLAQLESSFHGKSSGIDPLVSYLQEPLWISHGEVCPIRLPSTTSLPTVFLVDTHKSRSSTPFINFFVEQCTKPDFLYHFVHPVSKAVDQAITAWQQSNSIALLEAIRIISEKQLHYLQPMILPEWKSLWKKGLETGDFFLKLCGAGGGGFLLGFTNNWENTVQYFEACTIEQVLLK